MWIMVCQRAFNTMTSLMKIPILHYVKQGKDFILDTDGSQYAVEAVLSQLDENGEEIPVVFASKMLCKTHHQVLCNEEVI